MEAALLLLERRDDPGTYLFAKRHENKDSLPGRWSLPAEKIESGESPAAAATRCAREELGLEIDDPDLVEQHTFPEHDKTLYYFTAKYDDEPEITAEDELTRLKRYTPDVFFDRYTDDELGHGLQYLRGRLD